MHDTNDSPAGRPERDAESRSERAPRSERPDRPARSDRPARTDKDGQFARSPRSGQGRPPSGQSLVESIMDIDKDIIRLLAKRARLFQKVRGSRRPGVSSAPARDTVAEKQLREAWEAAAARVSRDPRFVRQLFALLQEVEIQERSPEGEVRPSFNLAPPRRPVSINIYGPLASRPTRLWVALAAAAGAEATLEGAMLGDHLIDAVKALNQAGAHLSWEGDAIVRSKGGDPLDFTDKVIYAGDDSLNFHLLAALSLGAVGKVKFTGGPALKMADTTALRQFLPQLGARLAPVVPKSSGLPVRLECSGVLPDEVRIPAELPADALTALLLAAPFWNAAITLHCAAHPSAGDCIAEVLPLLRACKADVATLGETGDAALSVRVTPVPAAKLRLPKATAMGIDPLVAAVVLAMPAFTGGEARLSGTWDATQPHAAQVLDLLRASGLNVTVDAKGVAAKPLTKPSVHGAPAPTAPLDASTLPLDYAPLALALAAATARAAKVEAVPAPRMPEGLDAVTVESFVAQLGFSLAPIAEDAESTQDPGQPMLRAVVPAGSRAPANGAPWASPTVHWTFGLALGALLRPGLHLSNPGNVTELMPGFWALYNGLPSPENAPRKPQEQKNEGAKPARRRIIAE
ncbi:chorismate mutase [Nitratidesulfovibrio sp. HK-II]|uniref:chorismate mutase n=1 Tax=Nitratidesulfovibrio sp. HK-II TaxID=2009266 RepID=UPI000E2EFFA1|nr:chorismate mutase [Nitratidesulfovibrio sp. HK-II]GBO96701.1 chorismate mutase I [Nitratidesulfovibrio sp. HK-II]